jgi:hypothetical protein
MKIFADENIPLMTIMELRSKGFDVKDIHTRQLCPKTLPILIIRVD